MEFIQTTFDAVKSFFQSVFSVALTIKIRDIIDIAMFAYIIYKGITLVRETRAVQLVKGILLIAVSFLLATQLQLRTMSFLLENVFQFGVFALLVVFQPELRRVLEKVGRSKLSALPVFSGTADALEESQRWSIAIDAIVDATERLSAEQVGAIMVLEKETMLGDYIDKATIIDSLPSKEMLCNLFFPNSPLHDGAVIMRSGRILAAGCFLPSSDKIENKELGSRHRAAVGMSENSDAVIIVVSEETGIISVAINGTLQRNYTRENLKKLLTEEFVHKNSTEGTEKKAVFWKVKSK